MGYTIKIGNAKPVFKKEYDELYAAWEVEPMALETAPRFPGDPTKNTNERSPTYCTWSDFLDWASLKCLFYDESDGLMRFRSEGGCTVINKMDYLEIKSALYRKKLSTIGDPGFDEVDKPEKYSFDQANLARLIWLEFWVRWALDNCETPAIEYG